MVYREGDIRMKRIMLLEPNLYHGEVLPGIVKYFEDLDYLVDVYIREEIIEQNAFCRYRIRGHIVGYSLNEVKELFNSEHMKEYDFLFLSSMEHSEKGVMTRFLDEIGFIPQTKYGVLGLYHTNYLIDTFKDYNMQNAERLFFISGFQKKSYNNVNILPPIYFGTNQIRRKRHSHKSSLLVVGSGMDISMLQEAYWKLSSYERKKLEIRYIGQMQEHSLKNCLYNYSVAIKGMFMPRFRRCRNFENIGKVSFERMYTEVEQADFILVLLDPKQEKHKHYIWSSTSGIRQLIWGFSKVSILHDQIARVYDFSNDACITFEDGKLCDALKEAIYLKQEEYGNKVQKIRADRNRLYIQTKKELEIVLDKQRRVYKNEYVECENEYRAQI